MKDIADSKPRAYENFAKDTLRRELGASHNETPYHVACNIQMNFEKKHGGKWVCILHLNSNLENCFWVEDDQDESYVELHVRDITCAIWKVRE